jgi:hypothetical protein
VCRLCGTVVQTALQQSWHEEQYSKSTPELAANFKSRMHIAKFIFSRETMISCLNYLFLAIRMCLHLFFSLGRSEKREHYSEARHGSWCQLFDSGKKNFEP